MINNIYPSHSLQEFTFQFEHIKHMKNAITVLYIHGLASNPWGRKPESVKNFCIQNKINFFRFELLGHGSDSRNYEKVDFNLWKTQILDIIDHQISGEIILVGHCIGGWLALLTAQERPNRLKGVICTSTAPNLAELMQLRMKPEQKKELKQNGKVLIKIERMTFNFTKQFIQTGLENAILDQKNIPICCPVHLLQGLKDTFIDWQVIYRITNKLQSEKVTIKLLKNGNHHLQHQTDMEEINRSLRVIMETV